jgi:hypothetical protein
VDNIVSLFPKNDFIRLWVKSYSFQNFSPSENKIDYKANVLCTWNKKLLIK